MVNKTARARQLVHNIQRRNGRGETFSTLLQNRKILEKKAIKFMENHFIKGDLIFIVLKTKNCPDHLGIPQM